MKKIIGILLFVFCMMFIGCTPESYELTIKDFDSTKTIELYESDTYTFDISLNNGTYKVESSDESIISVQDNKITALKKGECYVTIKVIEDESKFVKVQVQVIKKTSTLSISSSSNTESYTGKINDVITLSAVVDNDSNKSLSWKCDNDNVAIKEVNDKLEVTLKKDGKSVITLTDTISNKECTYEIIIFTEVHTTKLTLTDEENNSKGTSTIGSTKVLKVKYDDNTTVDLLWEVNNPCCEVNNGSVLVKSAGNAVIKVTDKKSGLTAEYTLECVKEKKPTSILELKTNNQEVTYEGFVSDKIILKTVISQSDEYDISVNLSYTKENDNVSFVNNGNEIEVTLLNAGKCFIKVQDSVSGLESIFNITIKEKYNLVVSVDTITLEEGNTSVIKYESTLGTVMFTVSSDIASIEDGVITAISEGTCNIKVYLKEDETISYNIFLTITKKAIDYTKLANDKLDEVLKSIPEKTTENLPKGNEDYTITYTTESKSISPIGVITRGEYDEKVSGTITLVMKDAKVTKDFSITILGTFIDPIYEDFISLLPNEITKTISLKQSYTDYGGTRVLVSSSNPDVFTNNGRYTTPFHDEIITLTITIKTKSPVSTRVFSHDILVKGRTIEYKVDVVKNWILQNFPANTIFYADSPMLPTEAEEYDATIEWFDEKGEVLDYSKLAVDPVLGNAHELTCKITMRDESLSPTIDYLIWNKRYNNTWEKIEDFVNAINQDSVRSFIYKSGGNDETNLGYLPFYTSENTTIIKDYMLDYTYGRVRTGITKTSTEYVVIHDTAGSLPTHTALSFAQDLVNQNKKADNQYISWHFSVGNDGIYQSLPLDEVGFHAGDGSYVYGDRWYSSTYDVMGHGGGNRNGIGIETCINKGSDYNVTMRMLAKLVAELMIQYNLSINRVQQHNFFSGKDCPGVIRHSGRWEEMLNLIKYEYFAKKELVGVEFNWRSLSADLLDNTGKVIGGDGKEMVVKYSVTAAYEDKSNSYTFESTIQEMVDIRDWKNL